MRQFLHSVAIELADATRKHGSFHSAHEGYAIILEELDEVWDEIKKKREERDPEKLYGELVQVAAMCNRFANDILGGLH